MLDPQVQLDQGLRYQKNGLLEDALRAYDGALAGASDPALRTQALCRKAWIYRAWCKWDKAIAAAQEGAEVARAAQLDALHGEALNAEAIVHQERGDFGAALPLFQRTLDTTADDRIRGIALQNLGSIAAQQADLDRAQTLFRESVRCFQRARYRWGEAISLVNHAAVALDRGRLKEAAVLGSQAMEAAEKIGDLELLGIAAINTAEALADQRQLEKAEDLARAAVDHFRAVGNDLRRAQSQRVLGDVLLKQDRSNEALRAYIEALQTAVDVRSEVEIERIRDCLELIRWDS
jgi:tetratricopeptide (TPR) repeat protein